MLKLALELIEALESEHERVKGEFPGHEEETCDVCALLFVAKKQTEDLSEGE